VALVSQVMREIVVAVAPFFKKRSVFREGVVILSSVWIQLLVKIEKRNVGTAGVRREESKKNQVIGSKSINQARERRSRKREKDVSATLIRHPHPHRTYRTTSGV
jgi:hypothetical protein